MFEKHFLIVIVLPGYTGACFLGLVGLGQDLQFHQDVLMLLYIESIGGQFPLQTATHSLNISSTLALNHNISLKDCV